MIIIGVIGFVYGSPMRLVYGVDYQGNTCGLTSFSDRKYTAYPRTNEDFIINIAKTNPLDYKFYGVCVSSCPQMLDVVCNYDNAAVYAGTAPYTTAAKQQCLSDLTLATASNGATCSDITGNCWITPAATSSVLFRCIPVYNVSNSLDSTCAYPAGLSSADAACIIAQDTRLGIVQHPAKPNFLFDQLSTARQVWGRWFGDLYRAWWVILLVSVGFGIIFGFVWLVLLKYLTGFMVWATIVLVLLTLSILTGFFYYKGNLLYITLPSTLQNDLSSFSARAGSTLSYVVPQSFINGDHQTAYRVVAFISTALTVIVLCVILYLRRSIAMAIDVIKIGADALRHLPALVFFPISTVLAIGFFLVWWIFVAACLATSGKITTQELSGDVIAGVQYVQANYPLSNATLSIILSQATVNQSIRGVQDINTNSYLLIYHFFGLLWTTQFILGIASMTICGTVCAWYFSQNEMSNPEVETRRYVPGKFMTLSSLYRTLRYYMGSVAIASFLVAFLQMVRAVLAYVQKRLKSAGKDSATIRFLFCCAQCCLKCLQSCVEMINRNAYVYIALKGYGYCHAVGEVFKLLVQYTALLMFVNILSEVMIFLGKVLIAAACGWCAYAILEYYPAFQEGGASQLSSSWLVIVVTVFFSYAVAAGFMVVFDVSVDSILICYVTDMKENVERGGANVAAHMKADKFDFRKKIVDNQEKELQALSTYDDPEPPKSGGGGGAPPPQAAAPGYGYPQQQPGAPAAAYANYASGPGPTSPPRQQYQQYPIQGSNPIPRPAPGRGGGNPQQQYY